MVVIAGPGPFNVDEVIAGTGPFNVDLDSSYPLQVQMHLLSHRQKQKLPKQIKFLNSVEDVWIWLKCLFTYGEQYAIVRIL